MPSLNVPPGWVVEGVGDEPLAAMAPEMVMRSFWVEVSEPQAEKGEASRLVRVCSAAGWVWSSAPTRVLATAGVPEEPNGALAVKE